MITLHKTIPYWQVPDLSPFVCKLETWLRMAGIPYETALGDVRKTPTRKVPFIEDDGVLIPDSSLIIAHLKKKLGDRLDDARLGPAEQAQCRAWKSLCETDLYFVILYQRWWRDEDFAHYRPAILRFAELAKLPALVRPLVPFLARRGIRDQLYQQGIARHRREEIDAIGCELVTALADALGDKPYFMGDRPCTLDASVYGMLIGILWTPFEGRLQEHTLGQAALVRYCERIRDRYWGAPS
ncbi:MAG TPA: glutathione S-transferase family protein [Polyangia bacterium]|jgi:glutathione S-transferase|nr:glutathione S-transferase family protein [Polyangia bacterium]